MWFYSALTSIGLEDGYQLMFYCTTDVVCRLVNLRPEHAHSWPQVNFGSGKATRFVNTKSHLPDNSGLTW